MQWGGQLAPKAPQLPPCSQAPVGGSGRQDTHISGYILQVGGQCAAMQAARPGSAAASAAKASAAASSAGEQARTFLKGAFYSRIVHTYPNTKGYEPEQPHFQRRKSQHHVPTNAVHSNRHLQPCGGGRDGSAQVDGWLDARDRHKSIGLACLTSVPLSSTLGSRQKTERGGRHETSMPLL